MADVLVVEDEESLLHTLRYNLSRAGHEVRLCTDGAVAFEMVRASPPDLVLLDVMLPGMDGIEVCRRVRAEFSNPVVSQVPSPVGDREAKATGLEVQGIGIRAGNLDLDATFQTITDGRAQAILVLQQPSRSEEHTSELQSPYVISYA